MSTTPDVSVVVASFSGAAVLGRCLERLAPQVREDVEVIVATDMAPSDAAELASRHPSVRFLHADEPPTRDVRLTETRVFRLRSLGVDAARGRVVALTEDHCHVAPGWVQALRAAHGGPPVIAGGPVDAVPGAGVYGWALFLCEYAALMPPLPPGPVPYVSGVNASYRRDALLAARSSWSRAFFENEVHDALHATGHVSQLVPAAWAASELSFPFRRALQHLFTGGRRFGGYRRTTAGPGERLKWLLTLPLVPVVLGLRIIRGVATRRPARLGTLVLGLPWIAAFLAAWSLGEARGLIARPAPEDFGHLTGA